jgi:hypothetical protein
MIRSEDGNRLVAETRAAGQVRAGLHGPPREKENYEGPGLAIFFYKYAAGLSATCVTLCCEDGTASSQE